MERSYLEGLGLEKDIIDKIMKEHGKTLNPYKEKADKYDTQEATHKKEMDDFKIKTAVEKVLGDNVHDLDLTISQLDMKAIKISKDGAIVGIEDQVTALKESKAFLFKEENVVEPTTPEQDPIVDVSGLVPAQAIVGNGGDLTYDQRLKSAREAGNNTEAIKIIAEAAQNGVNLI